MVYKSMRKSHFLESPWPVPWARTRACLDYPCDVRNPITSRQLPDETHAEEVLSDLISLDSEVVGNPYYPSR